MYTQLLVTTHHVNSWNQDTLVTLDHVLVPSEKLDLEFNNYNINLAYIKDCSNLLLATQPKIPKEHIKILGNIFKSKNKKIQTPFTLDNIVNVKIVTYN